MIPTAISLPPQLPAPVECGPTATCPKPSPSPLPVPAPPPAPGPWSFVADNGEGIILPPNYEAQRIGLNLIQYRIVRRLAGQSSREVGRIGEYYAPELRGFWWGEPAGRMTRIRPTQSLQEAIDSLIAIA